jgi:hypothetical protein
MRRYAEPTVTTTVRLPRSVWLGLRALAADRAAEIGGRPSASAVVAELVREMASRYGEGAQ